MKSNESSHGSLWNPHSSREQLRLEPCRSELNSRARELRNSALFSARGCTASSCERLQHGIFVRASFSRTPPTCSLIGQVAMERNLSIKLSPGDWSSNGRRIYRTSGRQPRFEFLGLITFLHFKEKLGVECVDSSCYKNYTEKAANCTNKYTIYTYVRPNAQLFLLYYFYNIIVNLNN